MRNRTLSGAIVAGALALLAGCTGGGGTPAIPDALKTPVPAPAGCPARPNLVVRQSIAPNGAADVPQVGLTGGKPADRAKAARAVSTALTPAVAKWNVSTGSGLKLCRVTVTLAPLQEGGALEDLYPPPTKLPGSFPAPSGRTISGIELQVQFDF